MHFHSHGHAHHHGPKVLPRSERALWVLKWSSIVLFLTALMQLVVVYFSGSVALLADTIHNMGDVLTSIPLWIAFRLAKRKPTSQFTYGFGRVEDLAGICIILIILASAIAAGYESIHRFIYPSPVTHLGAIMIASLIGFAGNELVAVWRIKIGKEIGSIAMVADGEHARIDGITSLAVLVGALGVYLGFPIVDTLVGFGITIAIFGIVWESAKTIFTRLLDGVEPHIIEEIRHACTHSQAVKNISEVRARWLGHKLTAEVNITLDKNLSIQEGHEIAKEVNHHLLDHLPHLSHAVIHVDPEGEDGEGFHHHREDDN